MNIHEGGSRRTFAGNYEIQKELGKGASAIVFQAHDNRANRLVAVKVFNADEHVSDIEQEARTQARLHHPNILPFHWYGVDGEHPYIAMMLARQGSLAETLAKGRPSIDDTVKYTLEAAQGVQYAHDEGVVHRDIKPRNLLLHEGTVRVSDWGIAVKAHSEDSVFTRQVAKGTIAYVAPEQLEGRSTRASDVYSLGGLVAFELAVGERPYRSDGDGGEGYIHARLTKRPPTFASVLGDEMTTIHEAIEPSVQQALSLRPSDRQKSMGDYAEELKNAYEKAKDKAEKETVTIDLKGSSGAKATTERENDERTDQKQQPPKETPENLDDEILDRLGRIAVLKEQEKIAEARLGELYLEIAERTRNGDVAIEELANRIAALEEQEQAAKIRISELDQEIREKTEKSSSIGDQASKEGKNSDTGDVALDAERGHPMINQAKEILGKDFLGVEAIRTMEEKLKDTGVDVEFLIDTLPSFPYTKRDLEIAKENGEALVLRTAKMRQDGEELPLTLANFHGLFKEDPFKSGRPIFNVRKVNDEIIWFENGTFAHQPGEIATEWAIIRKEADYKSHNEATVSQYLQEKGAKNINVRRRTTMETVWDTILYYTNSRRRLLTETYDNGAPAPASQVAVGKFSYSHGLEIKRGRWNYPNSWCSSR